MSRIFATLNLDKHFMQRCLQLARNGNVFPNPMVGAVVVHNNKIIGEGFHKMFGDVHAEINAIMDVSNTELLKDSTLYVSLEPCCHFGKTPPCTNAIIQAGIKKVVVGCLDPNSLMSGKGVDILRNQGVQVDVGIMEHECQTLNYLFFETVLRGEPFVHFVIKWAESADGFMGKEIYENKEGRELSNPLVKRFVHNLRSNLSAILIGTNTALLDNPRLDARYWHVHTPIAIILDKDLKISKSNRLFSYARKVLVLNGLKTEIDESIQYIKINFTKENSLFWTEIQTCLLEQGIYSVLIEGGSYTIQSFLNSGIKSEIIKIKTPKIWNNGIKSPEISKPLQEKFSLGNNEIEFYSDYAF